tara:strand:- start:3561 stop:4472 length:912 start_codon:yes stop_codon:yes gene_type:complete
MAECVESCGESGYSSSTSSRYRQGDDDDGQSDDDDQDQDDNGDGDEDDGIPGNNGNLVASASVCGNGTLEIREECDDSNRRDNDGCSSTCLLEIGICGDGIVQSLLGEQCEQSKHNQALPYLCNNCRFLSLTCGDGTVDAGEECDRGAQNSTSPNAQCRPDCSVPRCGDGIIDTDFTEECDDGNRLNGDACDRYCRKGSGTTQVASDQQGPSAFGQLPTFGGGTQGQFGQFGQLGQFGPNGFMQDIGFPQYPSFQPVPYQLPLAQLQPRIQSRGPAGDTGPAAVAVIGAGAAAGLSWMRRKRK